MTIPESTEQAISVQQSLTDFIFHTRRFWRFDQRRDLHAAMDARAELLQSGEFSSDFLDGLTYGLRLPLSTIDPTALDDVR